MRLDARDKVSDFGCGSGLLMPYVAPLVHSYTGVDFSQPFIELANAKKESLGMANASFQCTSVEAFCSANQNAFDTAFALDVLEHVYDEDWRSILKSIRSSLTDEGRLYIHTPNARFFVEIMRKHNFILKQFPEHVAVRTPEENVALLENAGFRVARMLLLPSYTFLRMVHPLSYVPLVGGYFKARIFVEAVGD